MLSNDELRGVLVQTAGERLLLPNTTVAEMMSRVPITPLADAPEWLVGQIAWQGLSVPVLSFARLAGIGADPVGGNVKLLVLKALGGNPQLPYFALLTPSFPRLVTVPRDGLLADATEESLPLGVHMRVLLGEESALLPDLERLETLIDEALSLGA
ncbi:chemotaxis protein CheW [Pseudoxanthomonas composti]|uniref:Chemotaxis protein CheW n=1 Tax=Pseudoxanthomonas composti TaxID=2137479 RepID=A0A4Q1JTV7_9GAMM|nr:chemotaxis protein CheW [Pseudoxanthomonas composti]RXR04437.1 chemotaxis protein CheW [Pseudoxanthomonas composti]